MRLDERVRPSCVKEAEVSSSSPFMKTGGKFLITFAVCMFVLKNLQQSQLF